MESMTDVGSFIGIWEENNRSGDRAFPVFVRIRRMGNCDGIAISVHRVHIFFSRSRTAVVFDILIVELNPILCIKDVKPFVAGELDNVVRLLCDGWKLVEQPVVASVRESLPGDDIEAYFPPIAACPSGRRTSRSKACWTETTQPVMKRT
jgi:hypothetical protein